ncbi:hypothetical protein [Penaeicola halotolerans]|uniref:hypothetical protein n=1 Tax=Penaeicola halotolerans TaxID=2793196 RepID=UPI001CF82F6C|nr:hypothetical protein [Penaeicola halotolerans]
MNKGVYQGLLILILGYFLTYMYPFWILMVSALVIGLIMDTKGFTAFISGFVAVGILWVLLAFFVASSNGDLLVDKIALLFPGQNQAVIYGLTFLVGGLIGGISSLTGQSFRAIFIKKRRKMYY